MDHDMHHPAPDKGTEPGHDNPIQPMHHGGDTGPGGSDHDKTVQPMHHGGDSGPPGSDHTTIVKPEHHGGNQGPHHTGTARMSTIWKISKNGSSYPQLSPSRSFFFHRSSSRFWGSGLIFRVPGSLPSPLPPLSISMAGIPSSPGS